MHPPPDLPAKIRGRNGGVVSGDFISREPGPMSPTWDSYHERSRGGELSMGNDQQPPFIDGEEEEEDFVDEADFRPNSIANPRPQRPIGSDNIGNGNGLGGYFSSALESPSTSPSRRGRPPVIRAAERHNRLRQQTVGGTNDQNMEFKVFTEKELGIY